MKSNFKRLGDYIRIVDNRNTDLSTTLLRGVSTSKKLIESVANTSGVKFTGYKIVQKGQFVYVSDTSRRGDKIALAMNEKEDCIVSSIYTVFEVIDQNILLPEFLLMWFKREEFDRYARFYSWGSARETFTWDDMCDVRVPILDNIEKQKKYVAIYNSLTRNQQCYENSLDDLQFVCNHSIELLISNTEHDFIGNYIDLVDERNLGLPTNKLCGININKIFMPSVANTSGIDFSKYKIVRKGRFACNVMHVGRDEKLPVALYNEAESAMVSPAYLTFEIKNTDELIPEFLMMIFQRPEFDRYTWFISDSSVRGGLEWERFCSIKIPIPKSDTQEILISMYKVLETRKKINKKLKELVTEVCPILFGSLINDLS